MSTTLETQPHVIIVGGGFGGLYTARVLARQPVRVTLIDRRNFHLFQPLLYQIATGSLSPGDISAPLRAVLCNAPNIQVLMDEVTDVDPAAKTVSLKTQPHPPAYDFLVLATGSITGYFGHQDWAEHCTGLKTLEDALNMRRQIFMAMEKAENEPDPERRQALMTFAIIGGGPTGVELAGALADLARYSLKNNFRLLDPATIRIMLIEAGPRLLNGYPDDLSANAARTLERMGITVRTETKVIRIDNHTLHLEHQGHAETLPAQTILWAAGVQASPLGKQLADRVGCATDRGGRIIVNPDLSVPGYPELFVIGDLAHFAHTSNGQPLPGVASVAIQQGRYLGHLLLNRIKDPAHSKDSKPFRYQDKGSLAVIGLNEAVASLGRLHLTGFLAWVVWALVHIRYLIGFENKLLVMLQWAWAYFARQPGARLITGPSVPHE